MVTVATGPKPTQPNPFSPVASVGGLLLGRHIVQREQQEALEAQRQREAENNAMLAALMGGQPQQGPGVSQAQGRNPLAALPEISLTGGQSQGQPGGEFLASGQQQPMATQQSASPQDPGGEFTAEAAPPAPSPRSSGVGSGPQAPPADPEGEALAQIPGEMGQMFRSMGPEQRARAVGALRESGVAVKDIVEMFQPERTEFGFMETDQGVVATNPREGTARVALEGQPEQRDPSTDIAKLRADFQNGLLTREEFQRQRDRILAGDQPDASTDLAKLRQDFQQGLITEEEFNRQKQQIMAGEQQDPMSTDELEAHVIQQVQRGELSEEEGQQWLEMIRGPGGDQLSAKARTIAALERRARGEETGSSVDAFSPERAGEIQEAMINQPQRFEVVTDEFGRSYMFDSQEGTRTLIENMPPLAQPRDEVESATTSGLTMAGEGELGIAGRLQQFGNVLAPQLGGQLPQPQRTELENRLTSMRENLVSVLRDNRRLLATQVAEIRNLLPDPNAFFESTPNALAKMLTLRGRLLNDRNNAFSTANDPRIPADEAAKAGAAVRSLDPIIDELTIPASTFQQATPDQAFEFAQALTPTSAQALESDAVDAMVGSLSEEQLSNLDPNVLMALQRGGSDGNAR